MGFLKFLTTLYERSDTFKVTYITYRMKIHINSDKRHFFLPL